ncbi:MAG: glycosyl transferase [Xanthobacteraceae bacterium]|jgi:glycosyltransferase involved in cell wall biosynthesis
MLSVIIATFESERALMRTLAALVPGATAGLISEVLVADAGSRDDTAAVADVAGCNFLVLEGPLGRRLQAATAAARAPWLMFLRPGTILDTPWTGEARAFVEQPVPDTRAAIFRRGAPARSDLREAFSLFAAALGARPRPEQGLIISKDFYKQIGGHYEHANDPEADLLRRIGRRRMVMLSTRTFQAA